MNEEEEEDVLESARNRMADGVARVAASYDECQARELQRLADKYQLDAVGPSTFAALRQLGLRLFAAADELVEVMEPDRKQELGNFYRGFFISLAICAAEWSDDPDPDELERPPEDARNGEGS